MPPTLPERYAVVSCHVERPLDDRVWAAFAALQARRPGGLAVAALLRPPDPAAGESDEETWLRRAREAAARAPLGHHTHFTSPTHARPTAGGTAERVRREAAWLDANGVEPSLFCGGGWYADAGVAAACAELGYVDCTPRARRPPYLDERAAWVELREPARIRVEGKLLTAVPTTHAAGDLVRALLRPGLPHRVHAYFHDTDLVSPRRRSLIVTALTLLGHRRPATTLDDVAAGARELAPVVEWGDIARGEPGNADRRA